MRGMAAVDMVDILVTAAGIFSGVARSSMLINTSIEPTYTLLPATTELFAELTLFGLIVDDIPVGYDNNISLIINLQHNYYDLI